MDGLDPLMVEHERLCRLNGKLEVANEIIEWAAKNRALLPEWVRTELAALLATATETRH